jgi:hypothetical protein
MTDLTAKPLRCAVYTRKSTEHNLDLAFTSLDAQREACEAYIRSQAGEGWRLVPAHYDDGGLSGASLNRPALQALLAEVRARRISRSTLAALATTAQPEGSHDLGTDHEAGQRLSPPSPKPPSVTS